MTRQEKLLKLLEQLLQTYESDPLEVVGTQKDGRPMFKWTKHAKIDKLMKEIKLEYGK